MQMAQRHTLSKVMWKAISVRDLGNRSTAVRVCALTIQQRHKMRKRAVEKKLGGEMTRNSSTCRAYTHISRVSLSLYLFPWPHENDAIIIRNGHHQGRITCRKEAPHHIYITAKSIYPLLYMPKKERERGGTGRKIQREMDISLALLQPRKQQDFANGRRFVVIVDLMCVQPSTLKREENAPGEFILSLKRSRIECWVYQVFDERAEYPSRSSSTIHTHSRESISLQQQLCIECQPQWSRLEERERGHLFSSSSRKRMGRRKKSWQLQSCAP